MKKVLVFGVTENPGGVESFLLNIYRHIDRTALQFDFLCNTEAVAYEEELLALGGNVYRIPARRDGRKAFRLALRAFFDAHAAGYSAIWVNVCSLANVDYLKEARRHRIPCRVIHCHNAANGDSLLRGLLHRFNRLFIGSLATDYWSCSQAASPWFYNKRLRESPHYRLIHNAIDLTRFCPDPALRISTREALQLEGHLVIGHVGRFHFQKNHRFLLEIFSVIHRQRPDALLLLVGQGELEAQVREQAQSLGFLGQVRFLGVREDLPALYNAMDLFLMPSLFEGIPFVGIEAQACGLPCLFSDTITEEIMITDLAHMLSLEATPEKWAATALELAAGGIQDRREQLALAGYDIHREVRSVQAFFGNTSSRTRIVIAEKAQHEHHAGAKARNDVVSLLTQQGWQPRYVTRGQGKGTLHKLLMVPVLLLDWSRLCLTCPKGSILLIQYPLAMYPRVSVLAAPFLRSLHRTRKIILLVHDLDSIRTEDGRTVEKDNERLFLSQADAIIAHNAVMARYIADNRLSAAPCFSLGFFDYLTVSLAPTPADWHSVAIAGNLDPQKAGYVYGLSRVKGVSWLLFGPNYAGDPQSGSVCYKGSFAPEQLPEQIDAGFGLIWDGDSDKTCTGEFGRYLRYNHPHKLSLYLAAGIPVIIWDEAAAANAIVTAGAGFPVSSLDQIPPILSAMTDAQYQAMRQAAGAIGQTLRQGRHLPAVLDEILSSEDFD